MYITAEQIQMQIEWEQLHNEYARQELAGKWSIQEHKGNSTRTQTGKGLMRYLSDAYLVEIQNWLSYQLEPKRGVQKEYRKLLKELYQVCERTHKEDALSYLAKTLAVHTLTEVINSLFSYTKASASTVCNVVGKSLYLDIMIDAYIYKHHDTLKRLEKDINKRNANHNKRYYVDKFLQAEGYNAVVKHSRELAQIGAELVNILKETTGFIDLATEGKAHRITPTNLLLETWQKNKEVSLSRLEAHVPTLIPPKPWTSISDGGYYDVTTDPLNFIRTHFYVKKTRTYKQYIKKMSEVDLSNYFQGVNKIQETPYKINKPILDIVDHLVDAGGNRAGIVNMQPPEPIVKLTGEQIQKIS